MWKYCLFMPIKKIIAFGSAKGGVGKSSITASIALCLSRTKSVWVLDADIYGPNQNILLEINEKPIFDNNKKIQPIKKNNDSSTDDDDFEIKFVIFDYDFAGSNDFLGQIVFDNRSKFEEILGTEEIITLPLTEMENKKDI